MFGIPTFDLLTDEGKQQFVEYIVNLVRKEIISYTSNYTITGGDTSGLVSQLDFDNHVAQTSGVHGATSLNIPYRIMSRDGDGTTAIGGIDFDTTTIPTDQEARLLWSVEDGGLVFGGEGGLQIPIGQKNVIYVKNGTGSTIAKGKSIMAIGAAGDRIDIALAVADGSVEAKYMLGVSAESIDNDSFGFVVTNGYVRNVNTNAWPVGTILHFDPTVPGGLTTTEPVAPQINLPVAIVTKQNASSGILYVRMTNGEYFNELHDVAISSVADGDVIKYNASTQVWENVAADDIPAHASTHIPGGSDAVDLTKIIGIGATLPTLPDSLYPAGALFGVGTVAPYLLYRSTGSAWDQIGGAGGGIEVSDTAPATPSADDLWYNSSNGRTYIYYDSFWVEVGNTSYDTSADDIIPAGIIVPSATIVEPTGWVFCYGQALSRTSYDRLYSAVGTTYGVGDGSTTFNLPDLRGRVLAGKDNMGGSAANRITSGGSGITGSTLGASGGAETHTLTTAQMPSHTHNTTYSYARTRGYSVVYNGGPGGYAHHELDNTMTYTGGNGAHQNTQPTMILNYLIKL